MNFICGIGYVNSERLLRKAVLSLRELWPTTYIIDNSLVGLIASDWPVEIVRPPVPLTMSQSINLLMYMGEQLEADVLFWMHNDAEAVAGTCDRLVDLAQRACDKHRRWGVIFTNYDCLAAFSMPAMRYVGPWDVSLPKSFADVDYYRRMRLAGFEVLESGLPVHHHNDGRSTARADGTLAFLQSVTLPLHKQYFSIKWGGPPHKETLDWAFGGWLTHAYIEVLRKEKIYIGLTKGKVSRHRGFLQHSDNLTNASQLETVRAEVATVGARRILETGTGNALFGYALSLFVNHVKLFTFDRDARCLEAVELLNQSQTAVRVHFTPGDSKETLARFDESVVDLACIHGANDFATTLSDIDHSMRLQAKSILVNDIKTNFEVAEATRRSLATHPEYSYSDAPLTRYDQRGLTVLRRNCGLNDGV